MKQSKSKLIFISVLAVLLGSIGVYSLVLAYRNKTMNAFDYVKKLGAVKSLVPNVGDRYDYGDYGFYSNNRVAQFSTKRKGTYNKEVITLDDGTVILLSDIFK